MRRWFRDRAQTEPVAAIVTVFAVCLGLLVYTGVLGNAIPRSERTLAPTALSAVRDETSSNGIVVPTRLAEGLDANPVGYRLNASLSVGERTWHDGPTPPSAADTATATVSVRIAPGDVRPGRLHVAVWE